ncbi:uncharacterized protein LOC134541065 [Bacillus rossius redtenbacheri]|uniref:uncharacterized protein LOC134541065 n=1 Tax=Bacillus rossius redtenbacheri TaxID=93214 RepID=UPI002FDEF267
MEDMSCPDWPSSAETTESKDCSSGGEGGPTKDGDSDSAAGTESGYFLKEPPASSSAADVSSASESCSRKRWTPGRSKDPRTYPPPFWTSTQRTAPSFAGTVPYVAGDVLQKFEVPTVACSDDGSEVYVGMYSDLRERVALLQAGLDFDDERAVAAHRKHRDLAASTGSVEKGLMGHVASLVADVEERRRQVKDKYKNKCCFNF